MSEKLQQQLHVLFPGALNEPVIATLLYSQNMCSFFMKLQDILVEGVNVNYLWLILWLGLAYVHSQ